MADEITQQYHWVVVHHLVLTACITRYNQGQFCLMHLNLTRNLDDMCRNSRIHHVTNSEASPPEPMAHATPEGGGVP